MTFHTDSTKSSQSDSVAPPPTQLGFIKEHKWEHRDWMLQLLCFALSVWQVEEGYGCQSSASKAPWVQPLSCLQGNHSHYQIPFADNPNKTQTYSYKHLQDLNFITEM